MILTNVSFQRSSSTCMPVFCAFSSTLAIGKPSTFHCCLSLGMGISSPIHGCGDAQEKHKGKDSAECLPCHFLFLLLCAAVRRDQHHVEAKPHGINCTGTGHGCFRSSGKVRAWGIYCVQNCSTKSSSLHFQEICKVHTNQCGNPGCLLPLAS